MNRTDCTTCRFKDVAYGDEPCKSCKAVHWNLFTNYEKETVLQFVTHSFFKDYFERKKSAVWTERVLSDDTVNNIVK